MTINSKSIIMLLLLNLPFFAPIQAQSGVTGQTIVNPSNPGSSVPLSGNEFVESVLVIHDLTVFKGKPKNFKTAVTMQLVNFRSDRKFLPVYTINGVGFNDDGKHNDQIAGDGIFTSVKKVTYTGVEAGKKKHYVNAPEFKYNTALTSYYSKNNVNTSSKNIGLNCKIRFITCPETHWWDSCWPLSSPCTCVEFFDCEINIGIM